MNEAAIVRSKEHDSLQRQLSERLIGELSVATRDLAPAVAEVRQKTGVQPPAWFNTGGVKLSDVNTIAVAQRARR